VATILVVDDVEALLHMLQWHLVRQGYDVITANTGAKALSCGKPDVLLTDFHMPDMDGLSLASAILRRHPGLPILFYTGGIPRELFSRARALGSIIQKGGSLEELTSAIQRVLEGRPPNR
jgi:two-component system response regulator GlrR